MPWITSLMYLSLPTGIKICGARVVLYKNSAYGVYQARKREYGAALSRIAPTKLMTTTMCGRKTASFELNRALVSLPGNLMKPCHLMFVNASPVPHVGVLIGILTRGWVRNEWAGYPTISEGCPRFPYGKNAPYSVHLSSPSFSTSAMDSGTTLTCRWKMYQVSPRVEALTGWVYARHPASCVAWRGHAVDISVSRAWLDRSWMSILEEC